MTADEILRTLRDAFTLDADPATRGASPARAWLVRGAPGSDGRPARVGVIASVTQPFCGACDRTRVTADGAIRPCRFSHDETSLRDAFRNGATDEQLTARWRGDVGGKLAGNGIDDQSFLQPAHPMSAIGG